MDEYVYYDFINDKIEIYNVAVVNKEWFEYQIGIVKLVPTIQLDGTTILQPTLLLGEL